MTVTIVVASGNRHKIDEIQSIIQNYPVQSFDSVFGVPHSAVEDGMTFAENAIKKVAFLPVRPGLIYMADDSGLEVDALGGRPGIHSARYAPPDLFCDTLLTELGDTPNRAARFVCAIALRFPDQDIVVVEGTVSGEIAYQQTGGCGFGYDPIFVPEGFSVTFAEMTPDQKNSLSHRGRALRAALQKIHEKIGRLDQNAVN